jgi:hypothetical protein
MKKPGVAVAAAKSWREKSNGSYHGGSVMQWLKA